MTRPKLRSARNGDIIQMVALARDARAASRYAAFGDLDEATLKATLFHGVNTQTVKPAAGSSLVIVADNGGFLEGMCFCVARSLYECLPILMVTDIILFAREGAHAATGPRLMKAMHRWEAKAEGPSMVRQGFTDAIIDPAKSAAMARKMGMRKIGELYETEVRS